jgi:hypothetical protein
MNVLMLFWNFDQQLLEQFERFAHWFQKWTGKDNFWLAWMSYWSMSMFATLSLWQADKRTVTNFIICLVVVALGWSFIAYIEQFKLRLLRKNWSLESQTRNPMHMCIRTFVYRVLNLLSVPLLGILVGDRAFGKALICSQIAILFLYYFYSCTPQPPGTSRIAKLFSDLKEALQPAVAVPQGSPA